MGMLDIATFASDNEAFLETKGFAEPVDHHE
jgi:hypothetical protein